MAFVVPAEFGRNAPDVHQGGVTPADTGQALIEYMCERIGVPNLAGLDVLDFGCGSRFADAIVNRNIPIGSYVGIDVYKEMVDWLSRHVPDSRLSFHHFNARNPMYNPRGEALTESTSIPVGDRLFDVICMFSVITHQLPADARAIFAILRRHVKAGGALFFSVSLEEGDFGYKEAVPESPTAHSVYSPDLIRTLVEQTGWKIESAVERNPRDLPILASLVCRPAQ